MTQTPETPKKRSRKRGCLIAALVVLVLIAAGWQVIERYMRIERYLPAITDAIEKNTGLPAHIGGADLRLLPQPSLAVTEVTVGEGDFRAEARTIVARPNLLALLRREIDIASVKAKGLVITLPEDNDEAQQRIREVVNRVTKKEEGAAPAPEETPAEPAPEGGIRVAGFVLRLGRLEADDAVILRGAKPAVRCDIDVLDVLSNEISAILDAALPYFAEDTRLKASVKTTLAKGAPPRIEGKASIENLDLEDLAHNERIPHTRINLQAAISGSVPDDISADVNGDIRTAVSDAFAGALAANIVWRDGQAAISGLALDSPGLKVNADARVTPGGPIAARIPSATAEGEGLRVLLALAPLPDLKLMPQANARVSIEDLEIGVLENGKPSLVKGNIALHGIDLLRDDGAKALAGIAGDLVVMNNALHITKLGSEGISIAGDVRPDLDENTVAIDLTAQAELTREKLALFLPLEQVQSLTGALAVEKLSGTFGGGRTVPPKDLIAAVRLKDINTEITAPQLAQPFVCKNLNGSVSFKDGVVRLDGLSAEGFKIDGKVRPDIASRKFSMDLALNVDLASPLVAALVPPGPVSNLGGSLAFKRIACTVVPGQGMPADLAIEGAVQNGRVAIDMPALKDQISEIAANFTSDGQAVKATARAKSATLGALQCDARYTLADNAALGAVTVDVPRAAGPFLPEGTAKTYGTAILAAYGQSTFDVTAKLPGAASPGATAGITRQGTPPLNVELSFVPLNNALVLGPFSVTTDLPLAALAAALPPGIQAEGLVKTNVRVDMGSSSFRAKADLSDSVLRISEYLEKKKGDLLQIDVSGGGPEAPFAPQTADISLLGEKIALQMAGGAPRIPNLDLNLKSFSRLITGGGAASGRLTGAIDISPVNLDLRLDNVGLALTPQVAIDSATGAVAYRDGKVSVQNLKITGADSDCVINAGYKGNALDAQVTGPKLNVNAIQAMYNAAKPLMGSQDAAPPAPATSAPESAGAATALTGTAKIDLQAVYYNRGRLDNVRGTVLFKPEGIDITGLSFRPYSGDVRGTIQMAYGKENTPGTLGVKLDLNNVDLRFVDEMAFAEPRGLTGAATGKIDMRFPLASGKTLYQGLDGLVDLTAYKGSYGKLGYATKLLTVLRSTEVIRLRVPKLRDQGLTFDTSTLQMQMKQGKMNVEKFSIIDKSYAIDGGGGLDFLTENMDVLLSMNILEAVTGIADRIPVVSQAADLVKRGTALRIRALGSPFDPKVNIEALPGILGEGKDKAAPVVNEILGVIGVGKKPAPTEAPAPEPAPAPTEPPATEPARPPTESPSSEPAPAPSVEATPPTETTPPPASQTEKKKEDNKAIPIVEGILDVLGGKKDDQGTPK